MKGEGLPLSLLNFKEELTMAETKKNETTKDIGPKMVKIRIPRTKKDEEDVFVSVNNYTCIIKRGVEVEVPDYVAEVLQHHEEMLEKIMLFEDAAQNKNK